MPKITPNGIPMIGIAQSADLRFENLSTKQGKLLESFLVKWGSSVGIKRIAVGHPNNRQDQLAMRFFDVPRDSFADLVEIMVDEIPHLFVRWSVTREDATTH